MSSTRLILKEPAPQRLGVIDGHFELVRHALDVLPRHSIHRVVQQLRAARDAEKNVFLFGNGGSAATALHFANDLAMLRLPERAAFRVQCLSANVSLLTAIANDFGYEHVFSRQLTTVRPDDVVIGISGSGNSPNCLEAFRYARERGAVCVGLLGSDGGRMLAASDLAVHVRLDDILATEDVHMVVTHTIARVLQTDAAA